MSDPLELDAEAKHFLDVYRWAKAAEAEHRDIAEAARAELVRALADHETGTVAGEPVVSWTRHTERRVDVAELRKQLPDVATTFEKVTERRRFTLVRRDDS